MLIELLVNCDKSGIGRNICTDSHEYSSDGRASNPYSHIFYIVVADPVQTCPSPKKQEKMKENPRQSIEEQGAGPYYCPDCGKGMGFDIIILKSHMGLYKGSCVELPRKKLHTCEHCHIQYTTTLSLKQHTQKFRGKCGHARKKHLTKRTFKSWFYNCRKEKIS